jgi:kinetochor protein Mis14/NSL1
METTHRKIELQSPLDLSYLINNAHVAARQKLDLHFPPSAAPAQDADDVMKARVDELVQEYIARVFEGVSGNLAVNGLEGVEMDEARRMAESSGQGMSKKEEKEEKKKKKERERGKQKEKKGLFFADWKNKNSNPTIQSWLKD